MSDLILRRDHGLQLDHIGLGVPDVKEGVAWVEAQTGAEVMLHDAEPGQWYQSGSLAIGGGSFLEIIGPNPAHRKFQPFGALLSTLDRPRLAFWYIAVHDFDAFQALAKRKGGALERVEHINIDHCTPNQSGYHRGYVGPGFMTERPNVIEWVHRPANIEVADPECLITDFRLANPDAKRINRTFERLGIDVPVQQGPSSIGLTLDTPKGPWSLDNSGISFKMPGMLFKFFSLWWKTR